MTTTITNMTLTATLPSFYTWTRAATVTDDNTNLASTLTASFNTDGTVSFTTSVGDSQTNDISHWHDGGTVAGIGNSRWAKRTLVTGDAVTGTLGTTITALSSARTLIIETVAGEAKSSEQLIEIYSDAGGTTKVGQITFTVSATV